MVCAFCQQQTHQYCYGLAYPTYKYGQYTMFICDPCHQQHSLHTPPRKNKKRKCEVCHLDQGLFKQLPDDSYVHVLCALTSKAFRVTDFQSMTVQRVGARKKIKASSKCEVCSRKEGEMVECSESECARVVHVYCSMKQNLDWDIQQDYS